MELRREGAPEERVHGAQRPRGTGWRCSRGEDSGESCSYLVYGPSCSCERSFQCRGHLLKEWQLDSDATEHVTPDGTGMADYTPVKPGTTLEIADGTFVPVKGFGDIDVIIRQMGVTRQRRWKEWCSCRIRRELCCGRK